MLSKGSVAVLPVLLLGIVWWLRPLTRRDLLRTAPFFLVAVVLTAVNMWFQTHGAGEAIRTASFYRTPAGGRRRGVVLSLQGAFAGRSGLCLSAVAHRDRQSAVVAAAIGGLSCYGGAVAV